MARKRNMALAGASALATLCLAAGPAMAAGSHPEKVSSGGYSIVAKTGQRFVPGNNDLFPAGADDEVVSIFLPFPITLYGTSYTRAVISSNGNVQFTNGSGNAAFYNDCLPSGNFNYPVVAPFWDDIVVAPLNSTVPGEGVFTKTSGSAPHRTFVVNWRGHHFSDNTPIRAGVVFKERSRSFTFQYQQNDAADASIGIQRSASGPATQWACNQGASVFAGLSLTFTPR